MASVSSRCCSRCGDIDKHKGYTANELVTYSILAKPKPPASKRNAPPTAAPMMAPIGIFVFSSSCWVGEGVGVGVGLVLSIGGSGRGVGVRSPGCRKVHELEYAVVVLVTTTSPTAVATCSMKVVWSRVRFFLVSCSAGENRRITFNQS